MSVSTTSPLGLIPLTTGSFDLERSPGNALARSLAPIDDDLRLAPAYRPRPPLDGQPVFGAPSDAGVGGGSASSIARLFAAMLGEVTRLAAQLAQMFGFAVPGARGASGQTAFADATASSIGDPHESFAGTKAGGEHVTDAWDSMSAHHELLSSDSFAGGYRLSNTVTAPAASGVTMNAHIGVATDGGATNVGMNADGSYEVTSFGRHVDLAPGRAFRLSDDESVTLNADRSLKIDERNAAGGSITTTLHSNGAGGVDATTHAHDVDLGGYLVMKSDADADPVASWLDPGSATGLSRAHAFPRALGPYDVADTVLA